MSPLKLPKNERAKKLFGAVSILLVALVALLITLVVWQWMRSFSREEFRDYVRSFGAASWLFLLALQVLQVFVALIPGEILETAVGYMFGPFWGTLLCYAGVALATVLVFLLTRRLGAQLVELFVPREKLLELRFLSTERRRNTLVFILFFIPGTPKDLITYFMALTDIKLSDFFLLSLTARLPSVLSSTMGGHMLGEDKYLSAILLYAVTGLVSAAGILAYRALLRRKQSRSSHAAKQEDTP